MLKAAFVKSNFYQIFLVKFEFDKGSMLWYVEGCLPNIH